jgi:hypothetical protein
VGFGPRVCLRKPIGEDDAGENAWHSICGNAAIRLAERDFFCLIISVCGEFQAITTPFDLLPLAPLCIIARQPPLHSSGVIGMNTGSKVASLFRWAWAFLTATVNRVRRRGSNSKPELSSAAVFALATLAAAKRAQANVNYGE